MRMRCQFGMENRISDDLSWSGNAFVGDCVCLALAFAKPVEGWRVHTQCLTSVVMASIGEGRRFERAGPMVSDCRAVVVVPSF